MYSTVTFDIRLPSTLWRYYIQFAIREFFLIEVELCPL